MQTTQAKRPRLLSAAKRTFWFGHIEAQQQCGLSINAFCRQHGLARESFRYWRRKQRAATSDSPFAQGQSEPALVTIVPVPFSTLERSA